MIKVGKKRRDLHQQTTGDPKTIFFSAPFFWHSKGSQIPGRVSARALQEFIPAWFILGKLSKNYFLTASYYIIKVEMFFETTATFFIDHLGVFMQTLSSKVTSKGQIVIPKKIRDKYGISPSTSIHWVEKEEGILMIPDSEDPIVAARGMLKGSGILKAYLKDKKREKKKEDKKGRDR